MKLETGLQGSIKLSFEAKAGRKYWFQYALGLGGEWSNLVAIPSAQADRQIEQVQTVSTQSDALFYRVVLATP